MNISTENASGEWELEFEPLDEEGDNSSRNVGNNNQTTAATPAILGKCIDEDSKAIATNIPPIRESNSTNNQKSFVSKGSTTMPNQNDNSAAARLNNNVLKKSITSSASFLELEKAIGATIALSLGGSSDDLDSGGRIPNNGSAQSLDTLQQHKIQRLRQKQQYQQHNNPLQSQIPQTPGSPISTRSELNQFLNEADSRSIILFHSPNILPASVRDACQKFGVLYYIRPEFHSKGVTLLCYFDLRSAIRAKAELAQQLGEDADVKVYYSIQLHASSNKSEEFRLCVKNIPDSHSETDVQSIFSRYGPIRTFEKITVNEQQQQQQQEQRQKQQPQESVEHKQSPSSNEENYKNDNISPSSLVSTSYHVEFFNIQDARLAASELSASSNQIFGPNVSISFSTLDERKQQMCKTLLTTLSKWRTELAAVTYGAVSGTSPKYAGHGMSMINHHPQFSQVHTNSMGYHNAIPVMNNSAVVDSSMMAAPTYMPTQIAVPIMYGYPTQPSQIFPPTSPMPQFSNSTNVITNYPIPHQNSLSAYDRSRNINDQSQNYYNQNYNRESDLSRQNQQQLHQQQQHQQQHQQQQQQHQQHQQQQQQQYNHQHYNQQHIQQNQPSREQTNMYQQIAPALDQQRLSVSTSVTSQVQFKGHGFPSGQVSPVLATGGVNSQTMYVAAHSPDTRPQHHNGGHGNGHGGRGNPRFARGPTASSITTNNGVYMNTSNQDTVDPEFALDLERLASGSELRTTVMVRNIPNKYHQHMLLEEVNINHEGSYDFFYLPIDFKNRCNVGYCFINFLEPQFIIPFVKEFHGQRWKSFNSEKVCVVTFARIQGKASMISRFQNSSLLEKDDEYQPLLFYSSGPDRGKQEPFPSLRRQQQQQQSQQPYSMQAQQQQFSPNQYQQQLHQQHQLRINYNSSPSSAADNYSYSYVQSDDRRIDHNSNNLHG